MRKLTVVVVVAFLLVQPTTAASYPITVAYGRSWPFSVVIDSARGFAYVDAASGIYPPVGFSFGVINLSSHELSKALPLEEIPGPMALNQANGDVYVAGNYSISVYDASTQNFTKLIEVGHPILYMTYDGNSSSDIFVTSGNQVYALDPQMGNLVANATVRGGPYGMALDPANGKLFVSEYLTPAIAVFRAADLEAIGTITLPTCCASMLALNPITQILYSSTSTNLVDVINAGTDTFDRSLAVAPSASNSTNAIAVNPVTGRVYVGSSPGGSVIEFDGASGAEIGTFVVQSGSQVAGLAVNAKSGEIYATNYHVITVLEPGSPPFPIFGLAMVATICVVGFIFLYAFARRRERRG